MRLICSEKVYISMVVRTKMGLRDWTIHTKGKRAQGRLLDKAGSCALRVSRRLASNPHHGLNVRTARAVHV